MTNYRQRHAHGGGSHYREAVRMAWHNVAYTAVAPEARSSGVVLAGALAAPR